MKTKTWDDFAPLNAGKYAPFQHISYACTDDPEQTLYLSLPRNRKNVPLFLFFHGGGMTGNNREIPDSVYDGEFAVIEARYRLSGQAHALAPLEDAAQAIAWCFQHAEEYSIDRTRIFVGGMSAGAYLAAITVMNPVFLKKYGLHYRDVAGLALISGQMTTHFQIKADLGWKKNRFQPLIDEYAPMAYLAPDLPPILMISGESGLDLPARPEENAFMAASLRAVGHPFVRYYALSGHTHTGTLFSCDFLLMNFLHDVLAQMEKKQ